MTIRPIHIVVSTILVICLAAGVGIYIVLSAPVQPAALQHQEQVLLGKFTVLSPPRPAPDVQFATRSGKPARLTDYRGHWLLVNLWATWCGPCIREMPSLDRMEARIGNKLDVVAIAEDRTGAKVVNPFVTALGVKSLPIGYDPAGKVGNAFHVAGLPTSFLIDPEGRIVAELQGAANWDARQTVAALHQLMTKG
ncbi:MAG: TlpA family protein disulfide reductase [Stellaceae bacterium]